MVISGGASEKLVVLAKREVEEREVLRKLGWFF